MIIGEITKQLKTQETKDFWIERAALVLKLSEKGIQHSRVNVGVHDDTVKMVASVSVQTWKYDFVDKKN